MSPGNEVVAAEMPDGALLAWMQPAGGPWGRPGPAQQAGDSAGLQARMGASWSGGLDGSLLTFDAASGGRLMQRGAAGRRRTATASTAWC